LLIREDFINAVRVGKWALIFLGLLVASSVRADSKLSFFEILRRNFSPWGDQGLMPEPTHFTELQSLLQDPTPAVRPSTQARGFVSVGYNLLIDRDCSRLLMASDEEIGRQALAAIRNMSSCLLERDSLARKRDGRRLLGLVQSGGVRVRADVDDRRPFRLYCDTEHEAENYAEGLNAYTEQWWEDSYPSVNLIGSRMVDFGITNWIQFQETLGHELVHLLGYRHDGQSVEVAYLAEQCCGEHPDPQACALLDQAHSPVTVSYGKSLAQVMTRRWRGTTAIDILMGGALLSGDARALFGAALGIADPGAGRHPRNVEQLQAGKVFGRILGEVALSRIAVRESPAAYWPKRHQLQRELSFAWPAAIGNTEPAERFVRLYSRILSLLMEASPDYWSVARAFWEARSLRDRACVQLGWTVSDSADRASGVMSGYMSSELNEF
jgi:hypothetical protein